MPLVDFSVGAGGADGGHGNAQPYDFRYLCPLGMAVNSSEAGVLWVPLPWHNVLLSAQLKGNKKKNIALQTSLVIQTQKQLRTVRKE